MPCPLLAIFDIYKTVIPLLPIKLSLIIRVMLSDNLLHFRSLSFSSCTSEKALPLSGIFRNVHWYDLFTVWQQQLNEYFCVRFPSPFFLYFLLHPLLSCFSSLYYEFGRNFLPLSFFFPLFCKHTLTLRARSLWQQRGRSWASPLRK